ncbi:PepSY-like domain-containing protein [Cellulophaga sp. HaHaR_3_176]|uniref:PepSY-like domain-containing protein n=1 Tax=Cellulophaga sp. HaHaR_3_176 TaxID=1942464 RepID=UPI001C1FE1F2|nr:PepSY-like domain-containing protein [Cellulophaga sp. HaHaR_3_176]QWX82989.1 PepSY-like domain-containing protein [Cellulophaga sp. HaHaR_3_176]
MKKQILIFGAVISIVSTLQAQDIPQSQVPSVILNEFNKQFPKATDLEWEMDGNLYNADFEISWNIDHEVWYNTEGKMVKHKEDISKSELPKAVNNRIQADFSDYSIDDLERITDNGKVVFKMELNALTQTDWDIVIDSEGKVISKIVD